MIKLIANYSKRLGLPNYSSHQFSVSVETELVAKDDIPEASAQLYQLLQSNVDQQMQTTGFVPPDDYGELPSNDNPAGFIRDPSAPNNSHASPNVANWQRGSAWKCSDKQKDLILKLVDEHQLEKTEVEALSKERFDKGVKALNKVEASGLIDELLAVHGGGGTGQANGKQRNGSAYNGTNGKEGQLMIATVTEPAFTTGLKPFAQTLPAHISPTAAKSYLACSLQFYFERVACIRKKTSKALHLGKAIHAALQAFHLARWRGGDDSPEAIAAAYEQAFNALERDEGPVNFKSEADREKNRLDGLRVIAAYLDSPESLKANPRAVEVMLKEEIPGLSVPLTGVMDLVEGNYTPVDFKSAAAKPDKAHAAFDHEIQLVSYQLLLESIGETPPSLDLVFLVKTKTPQVIRVPSPPANDRRKQRVIALLEIAVEGIASNRFHPQPGMQCSWCQFKNECLRWLPGQALPERKVA